MSSNPVPKNIEQVKILDTYMKDLALEQGKRMNLQFEQTLASLNSKVQNIFGPLCRIWDYIEGEYDFVASMDGAEQESNSEQVATVTEMRSLVEQTVLVLGQALNGLSYQRRTKG